MAVTPGFIDELRSRLSLSDLVGRRVKLVPKGGRLAGLCPFHNEKTPSFMSMILRAFIIVSAAGRMAI